MREKNEDTIIKISDDQYPKLLREINDPPNQLHVRGNTDLLNEPELLAVVGSRKANHYGQHAISNLLDPAVQQGVVLVSGLAFGIDSLAHRLSVKHNQPTIAVLGCGIDDNTIYPRRHLVLAHEILNAGGAIISEYPTGTPALPHQFPARNRIISGMCKATIVIQAAKRSGSLITARLALEEGRDVYAVPGAINDPLSKGTNHLIQQGATPTIEPENILDIFNFRATKRTKKRSSPNLSTQQASIINHLTTEPKHIDQLAEESSIPTTTISVLLIELELANHIVNVGGMRYVKKVNS